MADHFSESEAKNLIGLKLEAKNPVQSVGPGTVGTVIGAEPSDEGWVVKVRWKLRRSSFLNLMIGDACLNIPKRGATVVSELSKFDVEANTCVLS